MNSTYPLRMSATLRLTIFAAFGVLWASGCVWLILHLFFEGQTQFGPTPNPWEPSVIRLHGWIAVAAVFLLGWITAKHISERWPQLRKRVSGLSLAGVLALLVISGYGLYYTTDRLHDMAATAHEILGTAVILIALTHWARRSSRAVR
jgi:hypothetical protein